MSALRSALIFLLSAPIQAYRRVLSPLLPPRCRYYPTCSTYALESLQCHGPMRGLAMAAWRVLRCNPWSHGGHDPVPPPRNSPQTPTVGRRERRAIL